MIEDLLEKIKVELEEMGQKFVRSFTKIDGSELDLVTLCEDFAEVETEICGKPAVLTVGFPKSFPNALPQIFDAKNQFGDIPHKLWNRSLCITRNESLIIDDRNPTSILLYCLEKAIRLIEDGLTEVNKEDYINEFEVYWSRNAIVDIYAHIDTTDTSVRELNFWTKNTKEKLILISAEKKDEVASVISRYFQVDINECYKYRCLYLPLKEGTFILPPLEEKKWDFAELKNNVLSNLTEGNKNMFNSLVNKPIINLTPNFDYIIVGLPTPNGNVALFGYGLTGKFIKPKAHKKNIRQMHPFILKPKDLTMVAMNIERWHPNHLLNRTGGSTALKNKHILIVGVGSIGSEITMRFAKAGVSKISLVDYDSLELGNIHRHALGGDQVYEFNEDGDLENKPKVMGMKEEINRKYPFTKVDIYPQDILSAIETIDIDKNNFDLIVVAIGSPNNEMMLNEFLHKQTNPPPTIYTWVEPLGIGGHSLITLNGERRGCYYCLFEQDVESPMYNRSAFAEPLQDFSKTITGCGSVFTPYNFLDSERSAMLAVEAGIKVLMGDLKGNPLLSWKGNDQLFEENDYKTTVRYSFTNEKLNETKYLYINKGCPICSEESRDTHQ